MSLEEPFLDSHAVLTTDVAEGDHRWVSDLDSLVVTVLQAQLSKGQAPHTRDAFPTQQKSAAQIAGHGHKCDRRCAQENPRYPSPHPVPEFSYPFPHGPHLYVSMLAHHIMRMICTMLLMRKNLLNRDRRAPDRGRVQ